MRTDHIQEEATPDTISPDDALTLALTSKSFAKHVLRKALTGELDPGQAGASTGGGSKAPQMHPEAERRHNAKLIRENKIKADQLTKNQNKGPKPQNGGITRPSSYKPLWDGNQLRQKLQSYNRTPFLDILAMWMECAPTPQTIMAFADRYPDRWAKALSDLSKMGGFAEKKEIDFNFAAQVAGMSDSQLEDQLREQAYRLGIPLPALLSMMSSAGQPAEGGQNASGGQNRVVDVTASDADVIIDGNNEGGAGAPAGSEPPTGE